MLNLGVKITHSIGSDIKRTNINIRKKENKIWELGFARHLLNIQRRSIDRNILKVHVQKRSI